MLLLILKITTATRREMRVLVHPHTHRNPHFPTNTLILSLSHPPYEKSFSQKLLHINTRRHWMLTHASIICSSSLLWTWLHKQATVVLVVVSFRLWSKISSFSMAFLVCMLTKTGSEIRERPCQNFTDDLLWHVGVSHFLFSAPLPHVFVLCDMLSFFLLYWKSCVRVL